MFNGLWILDTAHLFIFFYIAQFTHYTVHCKLIRSVNRFMGILDMLCFVFYKFLYVLKESNYATHII